MKTLKFIVRTFLALTLALPLCTCYEVNQSFLITNRGYPLTGGYRYGVLNSGRHQLLSDYETIELDYHLNRLYFDDRYIVGEVTDKPSNPELITSQNTYTFFIFDTQKRSYTAGLNKSDFEYELKK